MIPGLFVVIYQSITWFSVLERPLNDFIIFTHKQILHMGDNKSLGVYR